MSREGTLRHAVGVPEVIALQSMFEGLFVQALQPQGAFKQRLREKGFDLDRQKTSYPIAVWDDCLDVASAELYPGQPRATAWRHIGRRFVDGYFQTLIGRMIAAMLPLLSAKRFMGRMPGFITTGLQGATVRVDWRTTNQVLITIGGVAGTTSALMAGVLEGALSHMKLKGDAVLEPRESTNAEAQLFVTFP
jgi:uncharacterized protein (TIGR02265 family)